MLHGAGLLPTVEGYMTKPPDAITLSDGTWAVMDELHGRDFRYLAALDPTKASSAEVDHVLGIVEARCRQASIPDILDIGITVLMELVTKWMGAVEEDALPPATAPGSEQPSETRRSTNRASRRASR